MTGPGEDSKKHKPDDAAKYLAESFFGLNLNPADVGGEVLFDDYDDNQSAKITLDSEPLSSSDRTVATQALASSGASASTGHSVPNRFEENLDELIVFSDEDDDDNVILQDEDDDENFDFGDADDEDDDDDDDDEEEDDGDEVENDDDEFDDDDEDDEEEDEDELDDEELDFGSDIIDPAPKRAAPVARDSRSARDERRPDSRPAQARSHAPAPGRPAAEQRPSSGQRGERRDERPAARSSRPQESSAARADSRGSERPPAKAADAGRKTSSSDDDYWKELDGWVWDDDAPKKPAAALASRLPDADEIDDDDDDDDVIVSAAPVAEADEDGEEPKRRRGRRRGGRGRGRGRRERSETTAPAADASNSAVDDEEDDDDFSEILFEEDQEDFVSVSAASLKAQRRVREEPPAPAARKVEPEEIDEEDDDVEKSETPSDQRAERPRRGRRGRRGRGRGREDSREPVRAEERPAASARRPARDEDDMDDDDIEDDDLELSDFGDSDDEEELPRRSEKSHSEPARGGSPRSERPSREGQGSPRGRGRGDREVRGADPAESPRRQPVREQRPAAATSAEGEGDREGRRGQRPPRVAAEFQDIPTWEEAIGSLAIRTPTEEHARRAESRGRRDGGGRPPRRRN